MARTAAETAFRDDSHGFLLRLEYIESRREIKEFLGGAGPARHEAG